MRPLRSQPRHATAHRLTLSHWRSRSNGGIRAGLVEDALGELAGVGAILVGTGDDARHSDIGSRRGQQRFPIVVYRALITALCRTAIQVSGSLQ
jgi:hypothetical protein